ncbi:MAG: HD domain-containing protein [Treponema sp.]|nr:HD domain-containing protein [Treponema sp.]
MGETVLSVLTERFTDPVRDVLWGHIFFTPELADLTASPPFMRLHRILQLGPVFRVYPGATHTRASHSIGVYHLGKRLLQNLAERGADQWLSPRGVRSFLCACLLHDLGHFPYTHSLKELPLRSHEELTGSIILKDPVKSLVGKTGADPEFTAAIVDTESISGTHSTDGNTELLFYRKLLSGCLDPDKLDYLNRDARYCGVPYGVQDVDFILSRLMPHISRGTDIDSRLIPNVEALLFSKYLMYRTVYWHRQVRSATAMIKKILLEHLELETIHSEELYNLDDQSLFSLLRERSCAQTGNELPQAVWEGKLYICAGEIPFIRDKHAALLPVASRSHAEEKLAGQLRASGIQLRADDLIIDMPEPASFETGLYVTDEECFFAGSSSAFNGEMVNSLIKTLYTIRIFMNPDIVEKAKIPAELKTFARLHDILNSSDSWLQ